MWTESKDLSHWNESKSLLAYATSHTSAIQLMKMVGELYCIIVLFVLNSSLNDTQLLINTVPVSCRSVAAQLVSDE